MALFRSDPEPEPQPEPIIAAAMEVHLSDANEAQEIWLARQTWQERVYGYFDEVGEVRFSTKFVGNALSKIRLVASEWPGGIPDVETAPTVTEEPDVKKAVANLQAKKGGQRALLRSLAQNLFLVGESWLVGHGPNDWESLSISELQVRPNEKRAYRKRLPALPPKPLDANDLLVRVWQEHPKYSDLADSAFRTVLGECEKLLLLSRADRAQARNRFAGRGLLFIPNELVPPSQQPNARNGQNQVTPGGNPMLDTLTAAIIEPIKDESHPSSVIPVVLTGPGDQGANIRYITFDSPADNRAAAKREEARASIAVAIDLPADVLTGKSDLNHWNAWLIREETFQQHLQPFVELICNALTVGYLIPALERAGIANPEKYVIWYDDSRLVARPNRTEAADVGIGVPGALSWEAWRRERGFNESDKPSDLEYAQRVGIALMDAQMAINGEPTVDPAAAAGGPPGPAKPGGEKPPVNPRGAVPKEVHPRGTNDNTPNTAKTPQPGSSKKAPITASALAATTNVRGARAGRALAQLDINIMQKIRVAASELTQQALSRAGARVRSKVKDKGSYQELLADVRNPHVARVLGPAVLESLELAPDELVQDAFTSFGLKLDQWLRLSQQQRNAIIAAYVAGAPDYSGDISEADLSDQLDSEYGPQDQADRSVAVAGLIGGLTAFAAASLFGSDTPNGPGEFDQIDVPAKLVRDAIEAAGGAGGIGVGTTTQNILDDQGVSVATWEWEYGAWERSTSFKAHEDLDGQQFSSMTDDALANDAGFPDVEFFHPGDHWGCLCQKAPILEDGSVGDDTGEEE